MAYEILNHLQVTPPRLHALLRLVPRLGSPTKPRIACLLQPSALNENQSSFEAVYEAARECGLIRETAGSRVELTMEPAPIESLEGFRISMRSAILGVTDEQRPNYLFNMYTAWYLAQDADVLRMSDVDFYGRFNSQIYPAARDRQFNEVKFRGWRQWAQFLGFGWRLRDVRVLMPDATGRLDNVLGVTVDVDRPTPLAAFLDRLGRQCPELDGGRLFTAAWGASHAGSRGNAISLAVSTGLRVLETEKKVRLIREADAGDLWDLFPGQGRFSQERVTHVARGERLDG